MSDRWEGKKFNRSFQKWFYGGERGFWVFLGQAFMWLIITPFVWLFALLAYILDGPEILWENIKKLVRK